MCDEQRPKLVFSELDRLPCIFFCRWGNRNGIIGRDRPEHRSRGAIKNKYFMDLGSQTHAASDFLLIFLGCVFKEMVFLRNVWQWGDLPHFPAVMYGCESWTVKKAEHRRIDAFELLCWRRLLRVPWTSRRSNQSILKEISPGCSLEEMMLKLKLQYFGHLMQRVDSLGKTLMQGGIEGRRRRGRQRMDGWMPSPTRWMWVWVNSGSWWWIGRPGMLQFMGSQRAGHDWVTELNWSSLLALKLHESRKACLFQKWPWEKKKKKNPEWRN